MQTDKEVVRLVIEISKLSPQGRRALAEQVAQIFGKAHPLTEALKKVSQ